MGATLPRQFEQFLRSGLPVGDSWPKWRVAPEATVAKGRQWMRDALAFDVEKNAYWTSTFGERPVDTGAATERAWQIVATWPALIPLRGHRFVVADGVEPAPVISVWQFVDSIHYGCDLVDWINREFGVAVTDYETPPTRVVDGWSAAFGLDG